MFYHSLSYFPRFYVDISNWNTDIFEHTLSLVSDTEPHVVTLPVETHFYIYQQINIVDHHQHLAIMWSN